VPLTPGAPAAGSGGGGPFAEPPQQTESLLAGLPPPVASSLPSFPGLAGPASLTPGAMLNPMLAMNPFMAGLGNPMLGGPSSIVAQMIYGMTSGLPGTFNQGLPGQNLPPGFAGLTAAQQAMLGANQSPFTQPQPGQPGFMGPTQPPVTTLMTPEAEAQQQHARLLRERQWQQEKQDELWRIDPAREKIARSLEDEARARTRYVEEIKERFAQESAATKIARTLEDEARMRERHLEEMKERFRQESAAQVARREHEEQMLRRTRDLDVQQAKMNIPGAAHAEAERQKRGEDQGREWQRMLKDARRDVDPAGAQLDDISAIGGLLGQAGAGGRAAGLMQQAPAIAEAGAAGGAGMAGAAGPVGAAILIADMAAKHQAEVIRNTTENIRLMGSQIEAVTRNDHMALFTNSIDAAASSVGEIPIVGQVFQARIEQMSESLKVASSVVMAFVDRGRDLQQVSGPIAGARAEAELRTILADIREADRMGPVIAAITEGVSEMNDMMREMLEPLKEAAGEIVSLLVDMAGELIRFVRDGLVESGLLENFALFLKGAIAQLRKLMNLPDRGAADAGGAIDVLLGERFAPTGRHRWGDRGVDVPGGGRAPIARPPLMGGP
jgi:hypothetical protein